MMIWLRCKQIWVDLLCGYDMYASIKKVTNFILTCNNLQINRITIIKRGGLSK